MKKIYKSALLFFIVTSMFGQTPTFFNYNNIVGSNAFPWGSPSKKIQWRINANSLGSVTGGNNITVVYFQNATAGTNTYPLLNISLKQGIGSFAGGGLFETGFTQVYSGTNVTKTGTAGGWISFTLTTPFLYDPTQPLFIDVEQNATSATGMGQCQTSPVGPGSGRQYGNYPNASYVGVDATVAHFGIDVVPAVPCSTTPSTNSIVGPTAAICPNASANMNVTNTYTAASGGIVYQWQSSTVSAVGPFTAISGATNSAYSAPNVTVGTWYNAVITCTNAVGSTISSPYNVTVSPVITSPAPYFEGFEGIGVANQLPNCSWSASNLPTTCQTYISSNTLGRMPRTGTKFASFFNSPAGTRYFYTNGIQLNAGITYSASVWYITDYSGTPNWTDMSIFYSTTQTPTGSVSIVSTNGPAVSNIYKSLSNTFSVPTSGIYYIGIRGVGTAGTAQYLTWDDLEITIPCGPSSPNTPTVSLIANTTTVCIGDQVNLSASGADTYTWSTGSNAPAINESPVATTSYYVIGTNMLTGCSSTVTQLVEASPKPIVIVVSNKQSVCAGSPANITVLGNAVSFVWSNSATGSNITVNPLVPTTYSVLATGANGCVETMTQAIGVFALPTIGAVTSRPNEMCPTETAILTASGTSTSYQWVSNVSSVLLSGNPVNVSPSATSIYTVTGTDVNGCQNKSTVVQNVISCTGITEQTVFSNLSAYPNPTSGEFAIESGNTLNKAIEVIDVTGKVVLSSSSNVETVKVNIKNLSSGIYYVKIQSNSTVEIIKVVKQ